jgi:hypothetical protein
MIPPRSTGPPRAVPVVLCSIHMVADRRLLVRLLALALVVTGTPALAARAPQALRAWIDVAGEVAPAQPAALRRAPAQRRLRSPALQACQARPSFAAIATAQVIRPTRSESIAAWPQARTGHELLDLKTARLSGPPLLGIRCPTTPWLRASAPAGRGRNVDPPFPRSPSCRCHPLPDLFFILSTASCGGSDAPPEPRAAQTSNPRSLHVHASSALCPAPARAGPDRRDGGVRRPRDYRPAPSRPDRSDRRRRRHDPPPAPGPPHLIPRHGRRRAHAPPGARPAAASGAASQRTPGRRSVRWARVTSGGRSCGGRMGTPRACSPSPGTNHGNRALRRGPRSRSWIWRLPIAPGAIKAILLRKVLENVAAIESALHS